MAFGSRNILRTRSLRKKILLGFIGIVIAGTILGVLNTNANRAQPGAYAVPSANFGSAPDTVNQAPNGTFELATTTTVAGSTTTGSQPGTVVITPNGSPPSSGSSSNSGPGFSQTSQRSGSIEFFTNVTLKVSSPQNSLGKASAIAYSIGGYVAFSYFNNNTAIAVFRVPASNYQNALIQIESLGNLTGLVSTSNDVSVKYTDLNATLQSLLTEQAVLLRLANQSNSLNATLLLQSQLQNVDAQINSIESQILQTRLLINYGTITATFYEQAASAPAVPLSLKLTATPQNGMSPLAVTLNAIVKGGSPPYIVNYNFGDGSSWQGQALIHTFVPGGTYNVTVTVTDSEGNVQETWLLIHVSNPPTTSAFESFTSYIGNLFFGVVEGIVEIAVVVIPIALVVIGVYAPLRSRIRSTKSETKQG